MYNALKKIIDSDGVSDYLFPSLPEPITGKIAFLSHEMVVVSTHVDGKTCEFITHPNNICIVQKKIK
jgi:hypothetical protein